jgi:hypothetical protein
MLAPRLATLPLAPLAVAVLLGWPAPGRGVGASGVNEVLLEYDASLGTLPDAQGWTIVNDDPPPDDGLTTANYSVAGGLLTQGPTGGPNDDVANRQYVSWPAFDVDFAQDVVVVDVRLRILESTITAPPSTGPRAGFAVFLVDAAGRVVVFYIGPSSLFLFGSNSLTTPETAYPVGASLTDYRLQIDANGASLSANGAPLAYLPFGSFGFSGSPSRFLVGDVTIQERSSSELARVSVGLADTAETEIREPEWVSYQSPTDGQSPKSVILDCPPGKFVVSGGAAVQGSGGLILTDSHPSGPQPYRQWFVRAEEDIPDVNDWDLRAHLICGEVAGQEIVSATAHAPLYSGSVTTTCPFSKVAVGHGAASDPDISWQVGLQEIGPTSPGGSTATARAYNFDEGVAEGGTFDVTAYATCSDARAWRHVTNATAMDSTDNKTVAATCPAGTVVIGGRARVNGATEEVSLQGSFPESSGGPLPDGWRATSKESVPTAESWSLEVGVVCGPLADATVTRTALKGRWRADSGLPDDDLGQNPGVLENGASIGAGLDDQAFSFERVNEEWLRIPGDDFYPAGSFTVDALFQTSSLDPGEYAVIANLYDISNLTGANSPANWSTWTLMLTPEGHPYGYMRPANANSASIITGSTSLADGAPHHIALVRDIRTSGSTLSLYVDGTWIGDDPLTTGIEDQPLYPGDVTQVDPVSIGTWVTGPTPGLIRFWEGLIDDVKFYDRALSPDEIVRNAGCVIPVFPRVINLDAGRFGATAAADDGHRLCVFLEAGTYTLDLVTPSIVSAARYAAWSPGAGAPWVTAYSAVGEIDPGVTGGSAAGDATPQAAFDNTPVKQETLVLTADQRVWFSVVDAPPVLDNDGGVSIYVPEPVASVSLVAGIAALLRLARVRRRGRAAAAGPERPAVDAL